jgi:hypothetical protein
MGTSAPWHIPHSPLRCRRVRRMGCAGRCPGAGDAAQQAAHPSDHRSGLGRPPAQHRRLLPGTRLIPRRRSRTHRRTAFYCLGIARPRIAFCYAQVGRRDDCSRQGKGRQRSEISDADRDCSLPSQFDFLSTKWRKARRRMQCNVISPHGTILSPAIGYN